MARFIRKIEHGKSFSRVAIPKKICESMGLDKFQYVTIDDHHTGYLIIRGLIQGGKVHLDKPVDTDEPDRSAT